MKNKLFKLLLTTMLLPAIGEAQTIYFDPAVTVMLFRLKMVRTKLPMSKPNCKKRKPL